MCVWGGACVCVCVCRPISCFKMHIQTMYPKTHRATYILARGPMNAENPVGPYTRPCPGFLFRCILCVYMCVSYDGAPWRQLKLDVSALADTVEVLDLVLQGGERGDDFVRLTSTCSTGPTLTSSLFFHSLGRSFYNLVRPVASRGVLAMVMV